MKNNQVFLKHILDEINFLTKETEGIKFEPKLSQNLRQIPSNSPLLKGRTVFYPPFVKGD